LGTGTSTAAGAAGPYLDAWGSILGNARWSYLDSTQSPPAWVNETDAAYALRLITTIARPSTTNFGMAAILECFFGLAGTSSHVRVLNAALATYQHYDQQSPSLLWVGDSNFTPAASARATGLTAGNSSLAGCFIVKIPLVRNGDGTIGPNKVTNAFILSIVNRLKAAGTQCTAVLASNDGGY
jgi:hypothetical protein